MLASNWKYANVVNVTVFCLFYLAASSLLCSYELIAAYSALYINRRADIVCISTHAYFFCGLGSRGERGRAGLNCDSSYREINHD